MTLPSLSLVVAYSLRTRSIGLFGSLPWPILRKDFSRLASLTRHHPVIMGRRTFESGEFGGMPLPDRRNIVLSRDAGWAPPSGVVHAQDWGEAMLLADAGFGGLGYDDGTRVQGAGGVAPEVFVLGGEMVYKRALSDERVRRVFATEVEGDWRGDVFFPALGDEWRRVGEDSCQKGWAGDDFMEERGVRFRFVTFEKVLVPEVQYSDGHHPTWT